MSNLSTEARELDLYLENDEPTYRQMKAVAKNLVVKMLQGKYDPALAVTAWMRSADFASQRYRREMGSAGGSGKHAFTASVRREVAARVAKWFEGEVKAWGGPLGYARQYNLEVPKKYQDAGGALLASLSSKKGNPKPGMVRGRTGPKWTLGNNSYSAKGIGPTISKATVREIRGPGVNLYALSFEIDGKTLVKRKEFRTMGAAQKEAATWLRSDADGDSLIFPSIEYRWKE